MTRPGTQVLDREARARPEWEGKRPEAFEAELEANRPVGDALWGMGAALMNASDRRIMELVALRTSAQRNVPYIWAAHARFALRAGLDRNEIARVVIGPTVFQGADADVLWAVDHVLANRPIDAGTRAALGAELVLAITVATKFYETIASVMQGAQPESSVPPVSGLETPAAARATYWDWVA